MDKITQTHNNIFGMCVCQLYFIFIQRKTKLLPNKIKWREINDFPSLIFFSFYLFEECIQVVVGKGGIQRKKNKQIKSANGGKTANKSGKN